MRLPDGTTLMHGKSPYDPVKAHEYYLRTRQLKGRKKGTSYTVRYQGKTVKLSAKELAEQKAYAAKRVTAIKEKLAELNVKLKEALREAQKKQAKSKREASKPPTAAEKSEAARESKKYRDKHKQELATKSRKAAAESRNKTDKTNKEDPVESIQRIIDKVSSNLKAAVARQRALAGATQNK